MSVESIPDVRLAVIVVVVLISRDVVELPARDLDGLGSREHGHLENEKSMFS